MGRSREPNNRHGGGESEGKWIFFIVYLQLPNHLIEQINCKIKQMAEYWGRWVFAKAGANNHFHRHLPNQKFSFR